MWIVWLLGFIVLFFILAQLITGSPRRPAGGMQKILPSDDEQIEQMARISTLEGSTPYFENFLTLDEKTPQSLVVSWKLDQQFYEQKLAHYHQENVDLEKAIIRLSSTGGRRVYEDHPVRLNEKSLDLIIQAPGSNLTAEMGFYTEDHNFVPFLTSNEVKIPE